MFKTTRELKFKGAKPEDAYAIEKGFEFTPSEEIREGAYAMYKGKKVFIPKDYYDIALDEPIVLKGTTPERGKGPV